MFEKLFFLDARGVKVESAKDLFDLRTLGPLELRNRCNGTAIQIGSRKARALLLILATAPNRSLPRSRICGLLWPGSDEALARQSLRQALSGLRRSLGPGHQTLLRSDDAAVSLVSDAISVDVDRLVAAKSAASRPELEAAADAYGGDFGLGVEIAEEEFDLWLVAERERSRTLAIDVFSALVRRVLAQGDVSEALRRALQLLELDPLREESHRLLLEVEARASGRASALARYESLAELLRSELGVSPEPATQQLMARISDASDVAVKHQEPAPVEKLQELRWTAHPDRPRYRPGRKRWALAAIFAFTLLGAGAATLGYQFVSGRTERTYIGDDDGRISLAVLPFKDAVAGNGANQRIEDLRNELIAGLNQISNVAVVPVSVEMGDLSVVDLGRTLQVRYVLTARVTPLADGVEIQFWVAETSEGANTTGQTVLIEDSSDRLARRGVAGKLSRTIFLEMALDRARRLSTDEERRTEALLARAEAAAFKGRFGPPDPEARQLYEEILKRNPQHFLALKGYGRHLVYEVSIERSPDRKKDLELAGELIGRAKQISPNNVVLAFHSALREKLSYRYEQALTAFDRTLELDPTYPQAVVQRAHVLTLLGKAEEAFPIMASVIDASPRDFGVGTIAYMAAETALLAKRDEDAVRWLRLSVQENPSVGRVHALLSAALQLTGRGGEAINAARTARKLAPHYTPSVMGKRGGSVAGSEYRLSQARYVTAYEEAYLAASRVD
jgi:DNA-binding SARP family transcriptional activator/TolB-like protein/predicted Zn-dependent protease